MLFLRGERNSTPSGDLHTLRDAHFKERKDGLVFFTFQRDTRSGTKSKTALLKLFSHSEDVSVSNVCYAVESILLWSSSQRGGKWPCVHRSRRFTPLTMVTLFTYTCYLPRIPPTQWNNLRCAWITGGKIGLQVSGLGLHRWNLERDTWGCSSAFPSQFSLR